MAIFDKIVNRKDFGDVLAEGTRSAAQKVGQDSEKFTAEVKGLEMPMHDGRALHGLGLSQMMSNRGCCHVQGMCLQVESNWCVYPEIGLAVDPPTEDQPGMYNGMDSTGKAKMTVTCEHIGMLTNACVLCMFDMLCISMDDLAKIMETATGFDYTVDELLECGDRIWQAKRGVNVLMGVTSADDRMTERMLTPFTDGGAAGSAPDYDLMRGEYYEIRGLDDNGKPTADRLGSLGLGDLAAKI